MKLPYKTLERRLLNSGYGYVCAVDEVGMGCLAGPVVVCAIGITNQFYKKHHRKLYNLRESKLLRPHQREKFASELLAEKDLAYALSLCRPETVDRMNIYQAARQAMRRSIKKLEPSIPVRTIVLVDGRNKIQGLRHDQKAIVKGDRKVFAIACASIIAKVQRDRMMQRYAKRYPGYGFERHKGYGTSQHRNQLSILGPSPIHRKSFRLRY